ncbi:hypothetical protein DYB32_007437 [Aphanomyces invadans]|uniref:Uncharacterized protein n=1 Tax=Aphanomyces invadans TaxID=157072 RepID=A0A3R6VI33_9STRA|nr:hypothetical protein DYB32_007437 [Aphanomyces invadans]
MSPPPNPRLKKRQWLATCGTISPVSKRRPVLCRNNNIPMVPWHVFEDVSNRCDDLEIEYAILQRHLHSKDLRIAELETSLGELNATHHTQLQVTCDRMERLQAQVDVLTRDKCRLTSDLEKAAAVEPQLTRTQHYMEAMHDAMMDMEFELMRLREESARLLTASSAKSQSNAIQRELRSLKKQRCVSQSKWLCDGDDEDGHITDMNHDGAFQRDAHDDAADNHTEATVGDEWQSTQSSSSGVGGGDGVADLREMDFLDVADQVVLYATEMTAAQLDLCTAMEAQLQADMWQYEKLLVEEAMTAQRLPTHVPVPHAGAAAPPPLPDVDALLCEIHTLLYSSLAPSTSRHAAVARGVAGSPVSTIARI